MKYLVIVFSVGALVVGAFAVIMLFGKPQQDATVNVEDVSVEGVGAKDNVEPMTGMDSLLALQAKNQNLECQIKYIANDGKDIEGTYFISDGKMRGDFVVPAPEFGGELISSVIVDDPIMYVWSKIGDETYGFKSDKNTPPADGRVKSKEPVPFDADVQYSCVPWEVVDGSVFIPPQNITFQDLGTVIDAGMEYGAPEL